MVAESAYEQLTKMIKDNIFGSHIEVISFLRPGIGITMEELYEQCQKL